MKKVGILYDNISRNTGDLAIGLSVRKMLNTIGISNNNIEEMIPGISRPENYTNIIIGGGLLIRNKGDFFYDKFRLKGKYILNSTGIYQSPPDLQYLEDYSYVSVRSEGDKKKISYLNKDISVVPDTTLLLEDISIDIKIKKPAIGIHCINMNDPLQIENINNLLKKYVKDFYIYLLPITHYNYDFNFLSKLYGAGTAVKHIVLLPILSPLEIFTLIGKFDYFISYSLHGAYFAYKHNVPFILRDMKTGGDDKMHYFMNERGLESYLFDSAGYLEEKFNLLLNKKPDYTQILKKDFKKLNDHIENIKLVFKDSKIKLKKRISQLNQNKHIAREKNLSNIEHYTDAKLRIKKLENRLIQIKNDLHLLTEELSKIKSSKFYKLWRFYHYFINIIKNFLKL